MPGSGNTIGGGVRAIDDRRGDFLPVETSCLGTVHGVQGGDYAQVADRPHADTAREGSGWETALGSHGPRQGTADLQNRITDRRGTVEMSS